MSITDELREWWVRKFPVMDKELHKDFTAIADRIDAEHESACAEAYGNGVMSVPIALDESAWVELPKDADDVPIRIGDVMDFKKNVCGLTVLGIGTAYADEFPSYGVFVREDNDYVWYNAEFLHHHVPTVEDVLREMLDAWGELPSNVTNEAIIAEYAAKLRLAEGEDA